MVRRNRGNVECELIFEAQLPALGYEQLKVCYMFCRASYRGLIFFFSGEVAKSFQF